MTVLGWRELGSERRRLYSPIGLRLVDDFTGRAPNGRIRVQLDRRRSPGVWELTDLEAILTPSVTLTWPGLGRESDPGASPTRRYRVRVEADLYRPDYLQFSDGLEFDAPPWSDDTSPVPITAGAADLFLLPSSLYEFPTWVPVLRGVVQDASGVVVPNVLVNQAAAERTLTDERGSFSLPLRWATNGTVIDAVDVRTGASGSHVLNLPSDLTGNLTITIV